MASTTTQGFDRFIRGLGKLSDGQYLARKMLRQGAKSLGRALKEYTPEFAGERDDFPSGQLKAGWFGGSRDVEVSSYVDRMPIHQDGSTLRMVFENKSVNTSNMEFASFVEEGHAQEVGRYVDHNGFTGVLTSPFVEGLKFAEKAVLQTEIFFPMLEYELQSEIDREIG